MSAKRGPSKGTKVRGNKSGKALSGISKAITGIGSLEHMAIAMRLLMDSLAAEKFHVAKLRTLMNLPPLPTAEVSPGDDDGKSMVYDATTDLMATGDQIVGLWVYTRGAPPRALSIPEGKVWVDHNLAVIKERSTYREINGKFVTAGEVAGKRKNWQNKKTKKVEHRTNLVRLGASPLRTIAVRLMPHEALTVGKSMTKTELARAVERTVKAMEERLGCEVISVAVHRMKKGDLHIHLQYTMVLPIEEKSADMRLSGDMRKWKQRVTPAARLSVIEEGRPLTPVAIGKRIKELEKKGEIDPRPTEALPVLGLPRFEKKIALKNLRNDAILGYSFKFKLNLVREIETVRKATVNQTDKAEVLDALWQKVAERGDATSAKFQKLAKESDEALESRYVDLWLEREWRTAVVAELPEATRAKLPAAAIEEAQKYAQHGTTRVEQTHLDRHNKDVARRLQAAADAMENTINQISEFQRQIELEKASLKRLADQAAKDRQAAEKLEDAAVEGLDQARQKIEGKGAPPRTATTIPEVLEKISGVLKTRAESAWRSGLTRVFKKICPDTTPPRSSEELDQHITDGISKIETGAVLTAWKSVFRFLSPDKNPQGHTEVDVQEEVRSLITKQVADAYSGLFRALDHTPPNNTQPDGFEEQANLATKGFLDSVSQKTLVRVVQLVTQDEDPAFAEMDTSELTAMLHKEIVDHKQSIKGAIENFARRVIGFKAMVGFRDAVSALEAWVSQKKTIAMQSYRLVWDMDPQAVGLTAIAKNALNELRTLLPKPVKQEPQAPGDPSAATKNQGDFPGGTGDQQR